MHLSDISLLNHCAGSLHCSRHLNLQAWSPGGCLHISGYHNIFDEILGILSALICTFCSRYLALVFVPSNLSGHSRVCGCIFWIGPAQATHEETQQKSCVHGCKYLGLD